MALLGKVEKAVFIDCFLKWETPEQVSQPFPASQDGKVVPVERARSGKPLRHERSKVCWDLQIIQVSSRKYGERKIRAKS